MFVPVAVPSCILRILGHILAAFERIELTPTYPPCREFLCVLCMYHNDQLCGTFWANFDLFLLKSQS